jgi:hypothetical protein
VQRRKISSKSRLREKLTYIHNHWDGLQTFLTDGRVEIDSSNDQNLFRPIALGPKNDLFRGSKGGEEAAAIDYTLFETCRMSVVDPEA